MHWFCRLKSSIMSSLRGGTITVIGRDKSGVVAKVTHCLFVQGANILALEEQVTRGQFSMTLQASWPASRWNPKWIQADLKDLANALGMEIKVNFNPSHGRQRMAFLPPLSPMPPRDYLRRLPSARSKQTPW